MTVVLQPLRLQYNIVRDMPGYFALVRWMPFDHDGMIGHAGADFGKMTSATFAPGASRSVGFDCFRENRLLRASGTDFPENLTAFRRFLPGVQESSDSKNLGMIVPLIARLPLAGGICRC